MIGAVVVDSTADAIVVDDAAAEVAVDGVVVFAAAAVVAGDGVVAGVGEVVAATGGPAPCDPHEVQASSAAATAHAVIEPRRPRDRWEVTKESSNGTSCGVRAQQAKRMSAVSRTFMP